MQRPLGRWPVRTTLPVLWGDMDAFAHVNNTVYLRWFECGRIAYFERLGLTDRRTIERVQPILAHTRIDFRKALTYPDTVTIETTVTRLGNSSFTMGYRVRSEAHDGALAAEGEGVVVLLDAATGGKCPLSEQQREAIYALEAQADTESSRGSSSR